MDELINVVVVEPYNGFPSVKTIKNDLKSMQQLVGGYIECLPFEGFDIICNEEGKLNGMTPNRKFYDDILVGTFFITKADDEGNFVSLNPHEIDYIRKKFMISSREFPMVICFN